MLLTATPAGSGTLKPPALRYDSLFASCPALASSLATTIAATKYSGPGERSLAATCRRLNAAGVVVETSPIFTRGHVNVPLAALTSLLAPKVDWIPIADA